MSYFLRDEYIIECSCAPDLDLCWKPFGSRPIGSSGPFTFPFTVEVDGEEITFFSFSQIVPGGSNPNITNWTDGPLEYAFYYSSACPNPTNCADGALFVIEADNCCVGSVTISEDECDFTSVLSGITTPVYQWQHLVNGIWTNISGETSSTYTGSDGQTVRLLVTDSFDTCDFVSNQLTGSCAAPGCSISCNLTWNSVLGRLELQYNISGTGQFDIQFNEFVNANPANCASSSGVGVPQCTTSVFSGIGTVNCPQDTSPVDRCFRAVIFSEDTPGCICIDHVLIPASELSCSVSINQVLESCTQSIRLLKTEASGIENKTLLTLQADEISQLVSWDCEETICGVVTIDPSSPRFFKVGNGWTIKGSDVAEDFPVAGDYVDSLDLHDNLGGSPTLDLNPATTPHLTGLYGTVDPSHLYWLNGQTDTEFETALRILIQNAIKDISDGEVNTDYQWGTLPATSSQSSNWLSFSFRSKHLAIGKWIGAELTDTIVIKNADGNSNSANGDTKQTLFPAVPVSCGFTGPCGQTSLDGATSPSQSDIDFTATDYNTVVLIDDEGDLTFFDSNGTGNPISCSSSTLTAVASGTGVPQYVWSTGETTQSISVQSGTFSVTVTMGDGCQATTEITV